MIDSMVLGFQIYVLSFERLHLYLLCDLSKMCHLVQLHR